MAASKTTNKKATPEKIIDEPFNEFDNGRLFDISWGAKKAKVQRMPIDFETPTIKLRYDFKGTHQPMVRPTKADPKATRVDVINSDVNRETIKVPRKTKYSKKGWY